MRNFEYCGLAVAPVSLTLSDEGWPIDAWPVPPSDTCGGCGRELLRLDGAQCTTCEGVS